MERDMLCRMGKIFKFLGMTVAVVTEEDANYQRRKLFQADVTYVTAMQLCFTYLYDNTSPHSAQIVSAQACSHSKMHL